MNVPLFDLSQQHQKLAPELQKAFEAVLAHGRFILGPEVELFEKEMAKFAQAKHAISCASGSDALLLALMAYDIGPGDEVITSPYTFFATASCIARLGARAVFVDICPHCYNLHPAEVLKKINSKTKAIIPIHLYGQCADMAPYLDLCKKRGIAIVEDACQALGASYQDKPVCTIGDIGCFSFYPSKNLGGLGDGGMLITQNDEIAQKLKILRVHGSEPKYCHQLLGINSRLDTFQAAFLRTKVPHLSEYVEARKKHAAFLGKLIVDAGLAEPALNHETCGKNTPSSKPVILPAARAKGHAFNYYVIRTRKAEERDALRDHLKSANIGTEIYYPVPLHLQKCFETWGYRNGDFPHSEEAGLSTLALPMFPELTESQLRYIADTIKSFSWKP